MNRRYIVQLTDELIGEAVLLLLKRKAPVNSMALLSQLRAMQETEIDARRRTAFQQVIARLETLMANKGTSSEERESHKQTDLGNMLSGIRRQEGKGKIH